MQAIPPVRPLAHLLLVALSLFTSLAAVAQPAADTPAAPRTIDAPPDPATLPQVTVLGTGGTIAGVSQTPVSFQNYRGGTLPIQDMVKQLPRLDRVARVSAVQFANKGSSSYRIADLYDLSLAVDRTLESADGVVVTTGTDTMEEIAYFLDLTVRSPKPVVVTGSMRPWTALASDGPANLYNAIRLAASGRTRAFGTVIMLNDTIHPAREVTKTNATRLDTFQTPQLGMVGYLDERGPRLYRVPARALRKENWRTPFDLRTIDRSKLPAVEIVFSYQEAGGQAIDAFATSGVHGIVTAGTGGGGISQAQREARDRAIKKGVYFVTTTRTGSGSNYPSERETGSDHLLSGDNLNPQHARIFLLLALAFSNDPAQIARWFREYASPVVE